MHEKFDAVVIGGGISGLITTQILSQAGYRVLLAEKEASLGGTNGSFQNARGDTFDFGYHTIDYNRSPFTTRYFARMLKDKFHLLSLRRGIALQGHTLPYNAPISEWPKALADKISASEFHDSLNGPPTRDAIEKIYGSYLMRVAFDEILPSYPSLAWQRKKGKPESDLMDSVYPWFFPQTSPKAVDGPEWVKFHQKVRNQGEHLVMYPNEGGFGAFIAGIYDHIDHSNVKVVKGFASLDVALDQKDQRVSSIVIDGNSYSATRYFWCAPLVIMGRLLGMEFPVAHPQMLCLGSYAFENELPFRFHEILIGEKDVPINRISFPGAIAGKKNDLLQIEFAYPVGDMNVTAEAWRADCLKYVRERGLIPENAEPVDYKYFGAVKGFISNYDPRQMVADFQARLLPSTNITYPYVGLEADNINRIVPSVFKQVYQAIADESAI